MDIILLVIRLLLSAVFLVAGIAKLGDLTGSRQALRDFGVPALVAQPAGVLLPLTELAVAVALIPTISTWWAAVVSLGLFLLFVAGISYNLARGRTPDCHCFGQLHSTPAGPSTLIRNLVLAALAASLVVLGRKSVGIDLFGWFGQLSLRDLLELIGTMMGLVALSVTLWLLFHVLRQQGRLLLRLEAMEAGLTGTPSGTSLPTAGLPVGVPAPSFRLPDMAGATRTLEDLLALGKPVLLLFASPNCGPCEAIFPEMSRLQRDHAKELTVAVISQGSKQANQKKVAVHGMAQVLLQEKYEVQTAYQVTGTPSLVLIRPDGTIGSRLAQGADAIRGILGSSTGFPVLAGSSSRNGHGPQAASPTGLAPGAQAPDFSLPDLSGKTVRLSDWLGSPTLLLFWRPGCGYCQRMLPALQAWEADPPSHAPRLLLISSESVQANQAMGLHSPIVLDPSGMSVGMKYGATGTPMAVLVDAEGRVASELATGAEAVLALAGVQAPSPA